tara:strand:+ start:1071 stop:1532 length:462 start_codon:yes stop_codon:yes gene_type:complete
MSLEQVLGNLQIQTNGEGFINITSSINSWIRLNGIEKGIINITVLHTSCSITINENADSRVLKDLSEYIKAIVPEEYFCSINNKNKKLHYTHSDEGIDDMPAHIKTALSNTCINLSIENSEMILGTWQAIYLWEHRYSRNIRNLCLHAIGNIG